MCVSAALAECNRITECDYTFAMKLFFSYYISLLKRGVYDVYNFISSTYIKCILFKYASTTHAYELQYIIIGMCSIAENKELFLVVNLFILARWLRL